MTDEALLELSDITIAFGKRIGNSDPFVALEDFSLRIKADKPEIIAIAGESGSGKTTLGRVALGLLKPNRGHVRFQEKDIWEEGLVRQKAFRQAVQAIFQDPFSVFNPFYPVEHLMRVPLSRFGIERDRNRQIARIEEALAKVGLRPEQILGRYPHQLSGGQRQRIVVARALMLRPKFIVADEPVSMIDASLRANVLENLCALRDQFGISVIYITHDLATARQVSDRLYVLYRGRAVETGPADQLIGEPQHPYTRLLMSSVPRPDPDAPWPGEIAQEEQEIVGRDRDRCVFIDRCPQRMEICNRKPPHFDVGGAEVACHLYAPTRP